MITAVDTSVTAKPAAARKRIITDFLIGAHAVSGAESSTRDRGFFASYFPELSAQ